MPADIQQKIQNMLDEIPDPEHEEHRREYSMSKQSARWMANMMLMILDSSGCNRGLTEEQAMALKDMPVETLLELKKMSPDEISALAPMTRERKKVIAILGLAFMAVLTYFGNMLLHLLDTHFWKSLFARLSQ